MVKSLQGVGVEREAERPCSDVHPGCAPHRKSSRHQYSRAEHAQHAQRCVQASPLPLMLRRRRKGEGPGRALDCPCAAPAPAAVLLAAGGNRRPPAGRLLGAGASAGACAGSGTGTAAAG